MRSCGRAISKYSAVMIEITEAHDAWCPPTFSPSRLGRIWLAWWIIHDDSHSSLRSSCFRMCTRDADCIGAACMVTAEAFMPAHLSICQSRTAYGQSHERHSLTEQKRRQAALP